MEILREVERQWVLSISVCAIPIILAGLCAAAAWRKSRARSQKLAVEASVGRNELKGALTTPADWNECREWEKSGGMWQVPPLFEAEYCERGGSPISPLWQRRILMGERCELPRFSGLILYDEEGHPLEHEMEQEKPAPVVTTLKDLL